MNPTVRENTSPADRETKIPNRYLCFSDIAGCAGKQIQQYEKHATSPSITPPSDQKMPIQLYPNSERMPAASPSTMKSLALHL
jgi:hypothetical protein